MNHPQVGALLAPEAYPDGTWATCTGTLISSTVFLTAAHCDQDVERVAVTFDASYDPANGTVYWGTWHADEDYSQAQSDPHDLAVVVFDEPVPGIPPAQLPEADSLDDLARGTRFTSGDSMCRATNVTYRLDTPSARSFLGDYVALP